MLWREKPDLLIIDLMLPDRDGWDITRPIRADVRLADIPIIMLTARMEDSDKIVGLEIGADDYITKLSTRGSWLHGCELYCDAAI